MAESPSKLAHAVLVGNLRLKKGNTVLIESWSDSVPYARTFVKEARRLGIRPMVLYEDDEAWWDAVEGRRFTQFADLASHESAAVANADGYVYFWGPGDRKRLSALPEKAQERATAWNPGWYKLASKSGLRGTRMWLGIATDPTAEMFHVDPAEWRAGLIAAGAVDGPKMWAKGKRVAAAIAKGSTLRLQHPNGTDLTFRLTGAKSRVDAGQVGPEERKRPFGMMANNPSGQVLVAVDQSHADGTVVANRTIYVAPDRFADQRFTFEDGALTDYSVGVGREAFEKGMKMAKPASRVHSYLSIGLNPFGRNVPPAEDTEEGGMTVGVGNNGFLRGKVGGPYLAPAMVGEGEISIDGRTIAKGGKVLL